MGLLKPRTTTVTIYHGDDMERLAELRRAVDRAERAVEAAGPLRGGDPIPSADSAKDAYDAFVDEAAGRAVEVRLTAIGRARWRDLVAEHPPRVEKVDGKEQTIESDAGFEVNTDTFPLALLTFNRDDARTTEVEDVSFADLVDFLTNECSEGDFETLWTTAYWLNRAPGQDPRLGKYSTATESSPES